MRPHPWLVVVMVGALVGVVFAGLSTYDFVQHLDRQVHSLHCSFVPGGGTDTGASGCQVAMMSEYSSVLRARVWGGIPISLPAMAVFSFLACFAIDLLITRRKDDPRATAFLALATGLPVLASLVMLIISLTKLGTTCKLCVAIYTASALCLAGGIGLWRRAVKLRRAGGGEPVIVAPRRKPAKQAYGDEPAFAGGGAATEPSTASEPPEVIVERPRRLEAGVDAQAASNRFLAAAFGVGVGFVVVPILVYLAMAPDHGTFVGTCGGLLKPEDTYNVMVRVERSNGGAPSLEILDPLCPACSAFEKRLASSGFRGKLDRKAILFPLDNTCNWMVTEATHPGACTVSEAVLCAGEKSPEVIAWAFEEGERIRAAAKNDPGAAARIVKERFPELAACVGSAEAKSRLNKSLRWSVANGIQVLTPQLFVANVKLCDEDVDLGLEYSLRVMLERYAAKTLVAPGNAEAPAPAAPPPVEPATPDKASDKPKPDKPKPDKASDKPDKASDTPDKASDTPDKPSDTPDKPSDTPDKPSDTPKPAEPADKPITSPSEAPAPGGTP